MKSCVRNQAFTSDWFKVEQGTRQGGKSSPLLYLLHINGLIKELERSKFGFCMYDFNLGSPTVADDMVLFSLSKHGLDEMLNICYMYSLKWRFEYNPSKCTITVFNEMESEYKKCFRIWNLGDEVIKEGTEYTHLGVIKDKYCLLNQTMHDASIKLRGTLLGITNSGISSGPLNPICLSKIYKSIVLPRALYGCELWNYLTSSNLVKIERAHRFCVKYIQKLSVYVNNDMSL